MCLFLAVITLAGCMPSTADVSPETTVNTAPTGATASQPPPDPIELLLDSMTAEELVGQLFLARYPGEDAAKEAIANYHIGSFILFSKDFETKSSLSVKEELTRLQTASKLPLIIATDEEGGSVTRVSCHNQYRSSRFPSPRKLYSEGGLPLLLDTEKEKCELLRSLGINVNLAPVCDIATVKNAFMYGRSLRQSPEETGKIITEMVALMAREQMGSVLKHFPGYGNNTDTHTGKAVDKRSLKELENKDLVPFRMGISAGCEAILVSHTVVACMDTTMPASLSPAVIDYLRKDMGFDGVVVTDDLVMDAITDHYTAGEAAVLAILAGNDLLCSSDYITQYNAVLDAVNTGRISPDRLRQSAARVLQWKASIGLPVTE